MIKMRNAYYCNLKLFLLYLVVYGHWIEKRITSSSMLEMQYRWIYLLHMPLFAFVSGLFLRKQEDCLQQIKRLLPLYGILQVIAFLFSDGNLEFGEPFWHLWYLLSFCTWAGLGWLYFRFGKGKWKITILLLSVFAGILAGTVDWIDRTLSFSRTIVFFPFFWLGLIAHSKIEWKKYRKWGVASLMIAGTILLLYGNQIPVNFLYHASPYGKMEHGLLLRLLCYILSSMLGLFCLTVIPSKRFPFSKAGADTMAGYLIHAPIVCLLRKFEMPWQMCAVCSALLLYLIYKLFQWNSPLYGIISIERRDRIWQNFRIFTKNTAKRSTDSFCP